MVHVLMGYRSGGCLLEARLECVKKREWLVCGCLLPHLAPLPAASWPLRWPCWLASSSPHDSSASQTPGGGEGRGGEGLTL